jgi:outer membrane protein assembly factor BamB
MIIQLSALPNGDFTVAPLMRIPAQTFGADQQTPIYYQNHIFGVRPDRRLVCMNLQGEILWHSGNDRFGLGPFTIINDLLFVLADTGTLYMIQAAPDAYHPLAQRQVLTGHDAWAPIACAQPYLLLRDLTTLICLDLTP